MSKRLCILAPLTLTALPEVLLLSVFRFLDHRSHVRLGATSQMMQSASRREHSWCFRNRLFESIGLYNMTCSVDDAKAARMLESEPESAERDFCMGVSLWMRAPRYLSGVYIYLEAIDTFDRARQQGHWWATLMWVITGASRFDYPDIKAALKHRQLLVKTYDELLPELKERAHNGDMLACHFLRTISQPFDHYMNPDNNQEWLNSQDTGFVMRRHPLSFEVDKGLMQRFEPKNEDDWSIGGTDAAKASMRLGYSTGRVEAFASAMEYIEEERCEETQRMFDDCAERGAIDGNTTCMFMGALSYLERGINIDRALRWLHVAAEDFLDGACAETLGDVYSHGASSVILFNMAAIPQDGNLASYYFGLSRSSQRCRKAMESQQWPSPLYRTTDEEFANL